MPSDYKLGDVLWLEHPVRGIPYDSGYYVLCSLLEDVAFVSLCGGGADALRPIDNYYEINRRDLAAFNFTGERAVGPAKRFPELPPVTEEEERGL